MGRLPTPSKTLLILSLFGSCVAHASLLWFYAPGPATVALREGTTASMAVSLATPARPPSPPADAGTLATEPTPPVTPQVIETRQPAATETKVVATHAPAEITRAAPVPLPPKEAEPALEPELAEAAVTDTTPEAQTETPSQPLQLAATTEPEVALQEANSETAAGPAHAAAEPSQFTEAGFELGSANSPLPTYPRKARLNHWEGLVELLVEIDAQGHPSDVRVVKSSGYAVLDRAALKTIAKRWRFTPETRNGRPVPSQVTVPVQFKLSG